MATNDKAHELGRAIKMQELERDILDLRIRLGILEALFHRHDHKINVEAIMLKANVDLGPVQEIGGSVGSPPTDKKIKGPT